MIHSITDMGIGGGPQGGEPGSLRLDKVRVLILVLCCLLISLKADGRFPVPERIPENLFQALLVPYTLVLVFLVLAFLRPAAVPLPGLLAGWLDRSTLGRLTLHVAVGLELLTLVVMAGQARKYASFGYAVSPLAACALVAAVLGGFAVLLVRRDPPPLGILALAGVVYALTMVLSITSFPLHPARSDMLPLVVEAGGRFLDGLSPYGTYDLPHRVPLTYLPGLWLAYLPAAAGRFDPRVLSVCFVLGSAALAFRAAEPERKPEAAAFCTVFLLDPYLQYRHEIYPSAHWLALAASFLFLTRRRPLTASLFFGWGVASSQFSWVLLPAYLLYIWKAHGGRAAATALAVIAGVAAAFVAPFLLRAPAAFQDGVFGHWEKTVNVTTANLSYFVTRFVSTEGLRLIQASVMGVLVLVSWRRIDSLSSCFGWMALTLLFFVLLNPLVWVYFFLTVFFLLVLCGVSSRGVL